MYGLIVFIAVLLLLIISISRWKVHPFIALVLAGLSIGLLRGMGGVRTVELVLEGFGDTLKWIAIVIVLGAFIGEVLNETGGAARIAEKVLKWTGNKLSWAMGITGYVVSIPVFVDVAYIILQPVTEALAARGKKPVLVVGLALTAGLTVSHTLIPPTPGPLAVAAILGADIGRLLLINALVGIFAMIGGVMWAAHFCKKFPLPYDKKIALRNESPEGLDKSNSKPSIVIDLLPILLPILLMAAGAFFSSEEGGTTLQVLEFFSTPMIAVLIGAGLASLRINRKVSGLKLNRLIETAIVKSALVIMITGAGGAFGHVIRETGSHEALATFLSGVPSLGFILPFIIAALLTTATGSITVSLIGTASIVGPMASSLPYSVEIMAALIGCGAFVVFHANASFFWLLNRLHEVPVNILYRTYTLQSLVMGLCGLAGVMLLRSLGVF